MLEFNKIEDLGSKVNFKILDLDYLYSEPMDKISNYILPMSLILKLTERRRTKF